MPGSRKEQVTLMFNRIAGRYDFLNHLLSFNTDKRWRKKLVNLVRRNLAMDGISLKEATILDVATGTGDLAFALKRMGQVSVTGVDLAENMLAVAREKARNKNLDVGFIGGDSEDLPVSSASFDAVTVAFGVRNYEDLKKGIEEMYRVLKQGGRVYILEFSQPRKGLFALLYRVYSHDVLPAVASFFSRDKAAYQYLPGSISLFPSGPELVKILEDCRFTSCAYRPLTGGVAGIYTGRRK